MQKYKSEKLASDPGPGHVPHTIFFSIVIPLHNKAHSIKRALDCVIAQTFANWECIVVDDGSSDRSPSIVREMLNPKIRLVQQSNRGPSAARNRGFQEARGEWIALLDADDYWIEQHLENLAELIKMHPECEVVCANFLVGEPGLPLKLGRENLGPEPTSTHNYISFVTRNRTGFNHTSATAIKALLWRLHGGFNEKLRLAEDTDFWLRLSLSTDFAINHEPSSVYTIDLSGLSTRDALYVGDAPFASLGEKISAEKRKEFGEYIAEIRMKSLVLGVLLSGNYRLARKMSIDSIGSGQTARAVLFCILSWLPTKLIVILYRWYRTAKKKPMPRLVNIIIEPPAS